MKKSSKSTLIKSAAIASATLIPIYCYIQNNCIEVNEINYTSGKIPKGFDGFKLLHLSDLHNKEFGANQKNIIGKMTKCNPDIIVITGDLIDRRITKLATAIEFVTRAGKIAPIYYVTGNHERRSKDYTILKRELLNHGVNIMDNKFEMLEKNGDQIQIMGLGDPVLTEYYSDSPFGERMSAVLGSLKKNHESDFSILLSHRPEYFYMYAGCDIDLTLTGHSHGGQIRVPGIGGLFAPGQGFLPEYCGGVFHKGNSTLISNRGLGNTSRFPFRINNRPEILAITLCSK